MILITERTVIRSVDRTALLRIFANILSNALKYSDGDLEITLDDDGAFVPGFSPDDCILLCGNGTALVMRWKGTAAKPGKAWLKLYIDDADIWSTVNGER